MNDGRTTTERLLDNQQEVSCWTTDYSKLKTGDVFELLDLPGSYIVQNVRCNPGSGFGIPTCDISTNMGFFTFDPCRSYMYRKYRVVRSVKVKVDNNHLDVVYKTLEEHRKCTEWKREKDEKARSREGQ